MPLSSLARFVAVTALLAPLPAAGAGPAYVGKWAVAPGQCSLPQDTIDAPVLMRVRSYDNFETHCDFSAVKKLGPGVWSLRAACSSAGDKSRDRLIVWANATSMTWKWANSRTRFNFGRCR